MEASSAGRQPGNHISLERLNRMEIGQLRLALEEVRSFQRLLKQRFRLELLR